MPSFRLTCCLCRRPIPAAADVHVLDREWQRRFPRMVGTIACARCAVNNDVWICRTSGGALIDDRHHTAPRRDNCLDGWDHVERMGTQVAMVLLYPRSGRLQGAEDYLRRKLRRPGLNPDIARAIQDALDE